MKQAAHSACLSLGSVADFQADKLIALTSAAKLEIDQIYASLLAKALEGKDIKEMLTNVGGGGAPAAGAPAAGGAAAAAGGDAPAAEEKKEEAKEESDDDMGFGLFD